ncbi:hypothetical protein AE618_20365, partial [Bosea vaviloviae]
ALSEQSAASAGSLSSRIAQLNALVAAFRTGNEGAGMAGSAPSHAPAAPVLVRPAVEPAPSEPARLRQLAETAFVQSRAPAKKVANSRASDSGWEEF